MSRAHLGGRYPTLETVSCEFVKVHFRLGYTDPRDLTSRLSYIHSSSRLHFFNSAALSVRDLAIRVHTR